jgi:hypothetical protein
VWKKADRGRLFSKSIIIIIIIRAELPGYETGVPASVTLSKPLGFEAFCSVGVDTIFNRNRLM